MTLKAKFEDNIILIGMAGCGKSTVGVILAKTLGKDFIDTDLIIQKKENRLLQQIITADGIDKFLEIEEKSVLTVENTGAVVATGGSVVLSENAMLHLKKTGKTVYIKVPFEVISKRLKNIKTRGIVMPKGQTIKDVFLQRKPLYEKYADIIIDAAKLNPEQIIEVIKERVGEL